MVVIGCYSSKNSSNAVYEEFLQVLEAEVYAALVAGLGVLVGGYFNAKSRNEAPLHRTRGVLRLPTWWRALAY